MRYFFGSWGNDEFWQQRNNYSVNGLSGKCVFVLPPRLRDGIGIFTKYRLCHGIHNERACAMTYVDQMNSIDGETYQSLLSQPAACGAVWAD